MQRSKNGLILAGLMSDIRETVMLQVASLCRCLRLFPGGKRAPIAIVQAPASHPCFLKCDEPTCALGVAVLARVVYLTTELQTEFKVMDSYDWFQSSRH